MSKGKPIKCSACFHKNKYSAKFCEECGAELSDNEKKQNKIENKNYLSVLFIAVLLSIIVVVYYNYKFFIDIEKRQHTDHQHQDSNVSNGKMPAGMPLINEDVLSAKKAKVESHPDNLEAIIDLANYLFDYMHFKEAINYYDMALSIDANMPDIYVEIGVCNFNLQKLDLAADFFEKALKLKPLHSKAIFNLGVVHFNLNNREKAIQTWENLVKNIPDSPEAKQAEKFL
ncbi:MAG: tetratricopeptide repeat protein, partial [Calditrichia bacterium]|nr:tetratricopeptide repeat protein [Calditrichia bacterium]